MAFLFPSEPVLYDTYETYTWDGQKWIATYGGVGMPDPPIPPDPPVYRVAGPSRAGLGASVIYDDGTGATRIV